MDVNENGSVPNKYVEIKRPMYKTCTFRDRFLKNEEKPPLSERVKQSVRNATTCTPEKRKKCCFSMFPVVKIMKRYKWRTDLPNDVIAGLTVGIMQLPQGMAYAMLADLPPVVGLYMSFFPALIYFLFGTSKQISLGTVAVVSLMTGGVVSKMTTAWKAGGGDAGVGGLDLVFNSSLINGTGGMAAASDGEGYSLEEAQFRIAIASSVGFVAGLIQVALGICRVGFVTTYMSDSLVSGFTTGAAVHVFTSQVKYALGIKIPRFGGLFQIINTYIAIIKNIVHTNIPELVITLICIVILYLVKVQINQRFKAKLKIPLPIELVVVILGTVASHFGNFHDIYKIRVVGYIPRGLPVPSVPKFDHVNDYGVDCLIIAIVGFAQSVSLAALMAKKHHYDIDSNKEFMAYGLGSFFGSFFSCYPIAASVSRSSVQDSAGGRTQVASIFSACLVLIVILFLAPLFEALPNCVLSAIIIVALRSLFLQILDLPKLFAVSPFDVAIWLVTFLCVVVLHVDYGLGIGIVFSFFTVVIRTQMASAKVLEKVSDVEVLQTSSTYEKSEKISGVSVIGFNSPLYYANAELFVKNVYRITGVKPERFRKILKKLKLENEFTVDNRQLTQKNSTISQQDLVPKEHVRLQLERGSVVSVDSYISTGSISSLGNDKSQVDDPRPFHHLIIDCSAMHFVDPVGVKILKSLISDYEGCGITVFLAAVNDDVWRIFEATEFVEKHNDKIYLTVLDAITAARQFDYYPEYEPRLEVIEEESNVDTALLTTIKS